jgi:hypothetical protein
MIDLTRPLYDSDGYQHTLIFANTGYLVTRFAGHIGLWQRKTGRCLVANCEEVTLSNEPLDPAELAARRNAAATLFADLHAQAATARARGGSNNQNELRAVAPSEPKQPWPLIEALAQVRAALPDASLAERDDVPREMIDSLNDLLDVAEPRIASHANAIAQLVALREARAVLPRAWRDHGGSGEIAELLDHVDATIARELATLSRAQPVFEYNVVAEVDGERLEQLVPAFTHDEAVKLLALEHNGYAVLPFVVHSVVACNVDLVDDIDARWARVESGDRARDRDSTGP